MSWMRRLFGRGLLFVAAVGFMAGPRTAEPSRATAAPQHAIAYVHYYLWWSAQHWHDTLGPNYPYGQQPAPAPGAMDASGCNPTVNYTGSKIVDVPAEGLADQAVAATFDRHIDAAVRAGLTGFVADWQGTGAVGQSPSSSGYDARLDLLVQRVDAYNAAHGTTFSLALGMDAYGNYNRPASQIIADLDYARSRYGGDPAFANAFSSTPLVMLLASRKFAAATVQQVSAAERPGLTLLGDETDSSWSRDAAWLDGSSWYWSSENPVTNSGAKSQVAGLGAQVRQAGKLWVAPFTAGFNTQLAGGSCVPRNGVSMLDTVWQTNAGSQPAAWFGISWNEFVENTYIEPSVNYGTTYLDELSRLISGTPAGPAPAPPPPAHGGYRLVAADGGVFPFGNAAGYGSTGGTHLNSPIVGMAATPSAHGYWLVAADGGVFPFGDAAGYGSTGGTRLNSPIVGMASTASGSGYWLVAADGGIFPFGDAAGYGSTGGMHLNSPIVGMTSTPSGNGYWLVAADGGIFPFGDAAGYGSTGGVRLNRTIVGMASTASGDGYWMVAADGGIFPFGDAAGYGSTGGMHLNSPIVGMASTASGNGYWLVAADGGIFPFGDAPGMGSTGGRRINSPIVGMSATA